MTSKEGESFNTQSPFIKRDNAKRIDQRILLQQKDRTSAATGSEIKVENYGNQLLKINRDEDGKSVSTLLKSLSIQGNSHAVLNSHRQSKVASNIKHLRLSTDMPKKCQKDRKERNKSEI